MSHQDHLAALRSAAQGRIAKRLFADAPNTDAELRALGTEIAQRCGAIPVFGPIKGRERSVVKVAGKFGGDWFGLTDVARMTIVANSSAQLKAVQSAIRTRCVASQGLSVMQDVEVHPQASPCGYSGVKFVIRMSNGQPGEIQANGIGVMYGQLSETVFRETIGGEAFTKAKGAYRIDGGLGHGLYEIYRKAPSSDAGKRAAHLSRAYFDYLRGTSNAMTLRTLKPDLAAFAEAHPAVFRR